MPPSNLPVTVPSYPPGGKRASPLGFIGALAVLTVVGAAVGGMLAPKLLTPAAAAVAAAQPAGAIPPPSKYGDGAGIKELPPIVTNLASPADAWIRLQLAMVYDSKAAPNPDAL